MKLIELLPLIDCSIVNVYEKREHRLPTFIVTINPKKDIGYISDDLLNNEVHSISIGRNQLFRVFVRDKKDEDVEVWQKD